MTKSRTKSQQGRSSRMCGKVHQRAIANKLKPIFPDAKSTNQSRGGIADGQDIENTPFAIECKHQISPNILAALAQADIARYKVTEEGTSLVDTRPPVAITRRKKGKYFQGKDVVTMRFEDWLELVKRSDYAYYKETK